MKTIALALLIALGLGGCSGAPPADDEQEAAIPPDAQPAPYRRIWVGDNAEHFHADAANFDQELELLETEAELLEWSPNINDKPTFQNAALPDWDAEQVLFAGTGPRNSGGFSPGVVEVRQDRAGEIWVLVAWNTPGGCIVTHAETSAFSYTAIPAGGEVHLLEETRRCAG